jgi:hypothetical protein
MIKKSGYYKPSILSEINREKVKIIINDFNFKMYPNIK